MIYINYNSIILRYFIFSITLLFSFKANAQLLISDDNNIEAASMQYLDIDINELKNKIVNTKNGKLQLPFLRSGQSEWKVEPQTLFSDKYHDRRPDVSTYRITSTEHTEMFGNLMVTENGVWSSIHTRQGLISIYPNDEGRLRIEIGLTGDRHDLACGYHALASNLKEQAIQNTEHSAKIEDLSNGSIRWEFSLAVVCTGEYYMLNGNSDNIVLDKMAGAMMGINAIFEKEIAVKFTPIDYEVFRDKDNDPFDPSTMENRPDEAAQGVNIAFQGGNYDIGHAFHKSEDGDGWGSGGIAQLEAVCNPSMENGGFAKARGWSGSFNTDGNRFISLASHEFAHMFGARHTFNGDGGFDGSLTCTDASEAETAYEIGSGSTIMSYQGLCNDDQNLPTGGPTDHYFHIHSLLEMITFINGNGQICVNPIPLNNTPPEVNPNECGADVIIPLNTPFFLKGTATDTENSNLLYCWEQYDEDGAGKPTLGFIGSTAGSSPIAPLFRSYPPSFESIRYFPSLTTLVNGNNSDPFEVLPTVPRDLLFQLTVRDQNTTGGGIASEELEVIVQNSGPLTIQNINSITVGEPTNITWSTNGSNDLCDKAKLLLSIDGGQTYPIVVAQDFEYSAGNVALTLPSDFPGSDQARLMLTCDDNACYSFFDVTDGDMTISSDCMAPSSFICDADYQVFDQGDATLDLDLTQSIGSRRTSMSETVNLGLSTNQLVYWNEEQTDPLAFPIFNIPGIIKTISVDRTGTYNFHIDEEMSDGIIICNLHEASSFEASNPKPSFISSNLVSSNDDFQASISRLGSLSASLNACEEYILTISVSGPQNIFPQEVLISQITGVGNVFEIEDQPSEDYASTFIAVDEDGIIEIVSPTSDFTALSGGLYDIYAVTYKSGGTTPPELVDPSTWVGVALSSIQSENCILRSSNKKQILVEFTCRINNITLGNQTVCDEISNTYSQEVIVTYESPPITGNLVVNGTSESITGSPQTVTLTGLISDGQPLGVSASFSTLPSCMMFAPNLIVAPENCCAIDLDLGGDRSVCSDESVLLDAGSDGVEYKWFKDGLLLDDVTGQTYEVLVSGNYLVEVFNDLGCSKFEVVNISIFETPTVTLEEDLSACEGDIFNLPVSTTAGNIQWYKDNLALPNETDETLLITEAGQYHVVGTTAYPLPEDQTLECSASDTINIEFVTRPIVDLGEDQQVCEGDPVIVLDAGQEGTTYVWSRNGLVISGEVDDELSVTESGQYIVTVDKGGGCNATDTVTITVFELEEVFAGQDVNICVGSTTQLNPFIDALSFEWYLNGVLFSDQSEMPEISEGGEYVLVGINEIGCTISDTVIVNEIMPPMPDLGEDKIGCIGSEVELSVEGIGNVFWTLNGNLFSMEDTIRVTEAGLYAVSILAGNDCNGFDEINITFEEGPMLSLGEDDSFCAGENFILNAMTNGETISWFKDGEEIMGESDVMLTIVETGLYSAIVTGSGECQVEDAVMITMHPVPDLDFTDNIVVCNGETAQLVGPEDVSTYQWTFEGVVISDQSSVSVTEGGQYILEITNEFGCSDSDVLEVITNDSPTLELEPEYIICEGGEATVEAISNASTYQWIVNGEELMDEGSNVITLSTVSTVEVIAISADGCVSSATTAVSIASVPSVDLGDDLSLCPDDSFVLDAGTHDSYVWSDGSTGATLNIFNDVTELTTTIYAVTVTSDEGCMGVDSVAVIFFPLINGAVELSATGVCDGVPVQLLATGGVNYTWIDDSGTLLNIDGPNATALPSQTTTYQVIIEDDCPGNESIEIVVVEVFEGGENIDAGEDDCAVNGKTVNLNASGGISYQWLDDPTIVNGADTATPTVNPTEETTYFVDITDENGCVFRDSVTICISEDPLESFELISIITPNGDGENDVLRFEGIEAFPDNSITIYNRWGYPVFQQKGYQINGALWNGENGGDILPADTYYYVLILNGETFKSDITILR